MLPPVDAPLFRVSVILLPHVADKHRFCPFIMSCVGASHCSCAPDGIPFSQQLNGAGEHEREMLLDIIHSLSIYTTAQVLLIISTQRILVTTLVLQTLPSAYMPVYRKQAHEIQILHPHLLSPTSPYAETSSPRSCSRLLLTSRRCRFCTCRYLSCYPSSAARIIRPSLSTLLHCYCSITVATSIQRHTYHSCGTTTILPVVTHCSRRAS